MKKISVFGFVFLLCLCAPGLVTAEETSPSSTATTSSRVEIQLPPLPLTLGCDQAVVDRAQPAAESLCCWFRRLQCESHCSPPSVMQFSCNNLTCSFSCICETP